MGSPWAWHTRWNVSCFSPFDLYLGDYESIPSPQREVRNKMAFGKKKDNRVIKNLSPPSEKSNKGKERVDDDNDDSVKSSDQEYIVFSFREDGSFNVVIDSNGAKSSESLTSVDGNSKSVTRKLHYGEVGEQDMNHHHIENNISNSSNQPDTGHGQCDQVNMIPFKEGEATESINLSAPQHRGSNQSIDSRSSNQSEGSRGSFAFPQLACEFVESPVRFPKSEDLHLNKQKIRCGRFQCFRFRR